MKQTDRNLRPIFPLALVLFLAVAYTLDLLRVSVRNVLSFSGGSSPFALFSISAGLVMAAGSISLALLLARSPLSRALAWVFTILGALMLLVPLLMTVGMPVPAFLFYGLHPANSFILQAAAFWLIAGMVSLLRSRKLPDL